MEFQDSVVWSAGGGTSPEDPDWMGGGRELCEDAQVSTWEDQWHFFTMSINRPNDTTNMQEQQF